MERNHRMNRIKLIGRKGTTEGYEVRDFLRRTVVDFEWIEIDADEESLRSAGITDIRATPFPVVEFGDGRRLFAPDVRAIADRLGYLARPTLKEYDVSIYGAGPAGLSAAVYAASEGLRTVVIERHAVGGQAGTSSLIENYLGFPEGIGGAELAERARRQALKFGAEIVLLSEGVKGEFTKGRIHAQLADGSVVTAKSNICATGVEYRRLNLDREHELLGNGVFYGAGAAEAPLCTGETVYVVGGANSAGQAAMHLADYADKVVMVVRGPSLAGTMSRYLRDRVQTRPNIEVWLNAEVTRLDGDGQLRRIEVKKKTEDAPRVLDAKRLFVAIGGKPHTEWAKDTAILRDESGYLITGPDLLERGMPPECWSLDRDPYFLETSVPGSFAVGDVRHGSTKRVASGVGEGAMAVTFIHRYLERDFDRLSRG